MVQFGFVSCRLALVPFVQNFNVINPLNLCGHFKIFYISPMSKTNNLIFVQQYITTKFSALPTRQDLVWLTAL